MRKGLQLLPCLGRDACIVCERCLLPRAVLGETVLAQEPCEEPREPREGYEVWTPGFFGPLSEDCAFRNHPPLFARGTLVLFVVLHTRSGSTLSALAPLRSPCDNGGMAKKPATCEVGWLDCAGKTTWHDAPAVAAVVVLATGARYQVCAAHLSTVTNARAHAGECSHVSGAHGAFEVVK